MNKFYLTPTLQLIVDVEDVITQSNVLKETDEKGNVEFVAGDRF